MTDYDRDRLYDIIEKIVWKGVTWDTMRKECASAYAEAIKRHASDEAKNAMKEFDR